MTARLLLLALLACPLLADLKTIASEPNLEKRSELALEHANNLIDTARSEYKSGKSQEFENALKEIVQAVELSSDSLRATGKAARRHPKFFKRAEIKTRSILKRLETLETEVALDDRHLVAAVRKRVGAVNDDLVIQIMTKKKS